MGNAKYISIWDDNDIIETICNYDPNTRVVSDIQESSDVGMDSETLIDEFVLYNGEEIRNFINEDEDEDEDEDYFFNNL